MYLGCRKPLEADKSSQGKEREQMEQLSTSWLQRSEKE
jgi:hypothetical protein